MLKRLAVSLCCGALLFALTCNSALGGTTTQGAFVNANSCTVTASTNTYMNLGSTSNFSNGVTTTAGTCSTTISSAGKMVVSQGGTYEIHADVRNGGSSASGLMRVGIVVNGSAQVAYTAPLNTSTVDVDGSIDFPLAAGDSVQFYAFQSSSGSMGMTGWLDIVRINDSVGNASDATITSPANNDNLTYNSTCSCWKNVAPAAGGSSTLAGLSDVAITSPANGDTLLYNTATSKWKNGSLVGSGCGTLGTPCYTDAAGGQANAMALGWWGIWFLCGLVVMGLVQPYWDRLFNWWRNPT